MLSSSTHQESPSSLTVSDVWIVGLQIHFNIKSVVLDWLDFWSALGWWFCSEASEDNPDEGCFLVEVMTETEWDNDTITQYICFCSDRMFTS